LAVYFSVCALPASFVAHALFVSVVFAEVPTPQVSPDLPKDVGTSPGTALQRFDDFSWRSFVALNWPAVPGESGRGSPDLTNMLGDSVGPRVWTTWKSRFEIFQPGGNKPSPWASFEGQNPCGAGFTNDSTTLSAFSAFGDFNQAGLTSAGNPLVAQNRTYVRYDIRVNEAEFDTIVRNKWYLAANLPSAAAPVQFDVGAVETKAAWRVLTDADTAELRARYFVINGAKVYDVASEACVSRDIALVGFHIVSKTTSRPQWIWSTFEHIDNVPGITTEPAPAAGVPWSFNDASLGPSLVPLTAPLPISKANPPITDPKPMQVVRRSAIATSTMATNEAYWAHQKIKGTVWENYMLVMTQWPRQTTPVGPVNMGNPFPNTADTNIANTTMETYFQESVSCMQCHQASNELGLDFVMFVAFDAFNPGVFSPADEFKRRNKDEVPSNNIVTNDLIYRMNRIFDSLRE
jgi:hypothetical protein